MSQNRIVTPSGRGIGVTGLGDPLARRLVVFCHPLPGASGFDPDPGVTRHWGLHLLTADRPGYGSSDPWGDDETPDVGRWASDLAAWLRGSIDEGDALSDVDYRRTAGVVGWGAGAAYALALARELDDRVDRLALVDARTPDRMREHYVEHGDVDIDTEDIPAGAAGVRIARMVEDAAMQGTGGAAADRVALSSGGWSESIDRIGASVLLVNRPDEPGGSTSADADWYADRIRYTSRGIVRGGIPVVHGWRHILEHVAPDHGKLPPEAR